ncbi:MAG: hypothetical protein CO162_00940 [bacterium (Candidatus Ratteibacteria) CG_4_9_14_3_um_filter_41_21]|uniref:Uncharacterized protein n=1 Tax=bacterium (Candidatus Ratteibacteria) CG_4_9_14_3_um_filter_41_21 TaxID=2014289 RepID=A0A2M7YHK2_9BACT|nr:MAG: hypothetical protein CO162_00940 [bacterium (Candidatus Ratteibacteria) CG_4_9_14_3_um_filter_41_21]
MQINDKDKITILLNLLGEHYNASHKMRERSLNFAIWILGFGVAIIWLLLSGASLTISQNIFLTLFVTIVSLLTIYFLHAIEKGFHTNRNIMIDIQRVLGCYEQGIYVDSKSLFPKEYEEKYKEKKGDKEKNKMTVQNLKKFLRTLDFHFVSIYIWIILITLMIILLIWINPNQQNQKNKKITLNSYTSEQAGLITSANGQK